MRVLLFLLCICPTVLWADTLTVNFNYDSHILSAQSQQKITRWLNANTLASDTVIIHGHTDGDGRSSYNDTLAMLRANSVKNIINQHKSNLIYTIHSSGEHAPIATNATNRGKALNRRVDIICHLAPTETTNPNDNALSKITLEVGKIITLKNLNFYGGRHYLLQQSIPPLKELLQLMVNNPTLQIEIIGHVCCSPPDQDGYDIDSKTYNLSENRAEAIYNYLKLEGIDESRMSFKGMGGSQPLVQEITEDDQRTNRRVEFKVVKL